MQEELQYQEKEMTKEQILNQIKSYEPIAARNSMGCSENWYNPFYAMKMTFDEETLDNMSEVELNNLMKLAENISEGLY